MLENVTSDMTSSPTITIAVPALNEERHLKQTVEQILQALEQTNWSDYQIIIINDGSDDNTCNIANSLKNDQISILHNSVPKGLGYALQKGISLASMDYFIEIHGKNDISTLELTKILGARSAADLIIPFQVNTDERKLIRRSLSKLFVTLLNRLTGNKLNYYNHYIMTKTNHLRDLTIGTNSYAVQAEIIIRLLKKNLTYKQVGVIDTFHEDGPTKAFRMRNIAGVSLFLIKILLDKLRLKKL